MTLAARPLPDGPFPVPAMPRPLTALVAGALTPAGVALSRALVARNAVVYVADGDLAGAVHLAGALGPTAFALALRADDEVLDRHLGVTT